MFANWVLERSSTGVTKIPKEKNQKICQVCHSQDNTKPLRSRSVINVTEIFFVLSLIHTGYLACCKCLACFAFSRDDFCPWPS